MTELLGYLGLALAIAGVLCSVFYRAGLLEGRRRQNDALADLLLEYNDHHGNQENFPH